VGSVAGGIAPRLADDSNRGPTRPPDPPRLAPKE